MAKIHLHQAAQVRFLGISASNILRHMMPAIKVYLGDEATIDPLGLEEKESVSLAKNTWIGTRYSGQSCSDAEGSHSRWDYVSAPLPGQDGEGSLQATLNALNRLFGGRGWLFPQPWI